MTNFCCVTLTAIHDPVLIASFYFRETIHLTAFSDERLLRKEEKSHTSFNAVNTELFKKGLPQQQHIIKIIFALVFRNYKKKKYVKGDQVALQKD